MLDALDAVPGPVHVRSEEVEQVTEEFVAALVEADVRRRHLALSGLVLDGPDGSSPEPLPEPPHDPLYAAVERWAASPELLTAGHGGG
jgi:hypothetical protein